MRNEARKVAVNTIFNTVGGISVQLLTIVTGIFVARHFGAKNFGQLTLAATIIGYFTLITEFGLSTIAIRVVARTGEPERYLWSYLTTRLGLSILALIILGGLMAIAQFLRPTVWLIFAYACTIPLQVLKLNWLFYAQQNMLIENVLQIIEKLIYAFCLFVLVFMVQDIVAVPVAMAISILIIAALGWALFMRSTKRPILWRLDWSFIREMTTQGWPVGVAGAALQSNTNVDTIFVNAYHGDVQTGLYGAAYRLISAMITAGTFFTNAIFPLSCKRYKESTSSLADFIGYSSKLLILVTIPGVILLSVSSEEIIGLIFGKGYAGAAEPFRLLVWAAGIAIICRLYHNTLVACDRQHAFMKIILISAVFNIACNFLLIPSFGMIGAAAATVITELFLLAMTYVVLSRVLDIRLLPSLTAVLGIAGAASSALLLPVPLVVRLSMFIVVYILLVLWSRLLGNREWQLVKVMLGKA